jgi:hypothetical protein
MLAAIVVVLNGAFLPSAPPVRRLFGHIVAPLAPVMTRIADRVTLDGDAIELVRGAHACAFRIGVPAFRCDARIRLAAVTPFARDGIAYVPLADVVRAFGGTATYDAPSGTVALTLAPSTAVDTPAPFDPAAPQAVPTRLFTPQPAPPTPQAIESGEPRPRRTAIPAIPSRVPD